MESMNNTVFQCMGYTTDYHCRRSEVDNPQEVIDSFYAHHDLETCLTKEEALQALHGKGKVELIGYSNCCTFIDPVLKYQARCDAEEWCKAHNVSTNHIKETEKGYKVTIEFHY